MTPLRVDGMKAFLIDQPGAGMTARTCISARAARSRINNPPPSHPHRQAQKKKEEVAMEWNDY